MDLQVSIHYGIPLTASILAFDPIQRLLAIGTLDGRIKVIGGNSIEGLLVSRNRSPYKFIEFLQNKGVLIGISNDNVIEGWNLESRHLCSCLDWGSIITAFRVMDGSNFIYIGDERGMVSVVKYDGCIQTLLKLPYQISVPVQDAAVECSISSNEPVVEILVQPCSSGNRVLIVYQHGLLALWDIIEARIIDLRGDKNLQFKYRFLSSEGNYSIQSGSAPSVEGKEISAVCWASYEGSIVSVGYVDGDILFWDMLTVDSSEVQQFESTSDAVKLQLSASERRLPVIMLHWLRNDSFHNRNNGRLFVYGGDEIGSDEQLTILNLECSSSLKTLRCIGHVNLNLTGSFSDMLLLSTVEETEYGSDVPLFVLTNPGVVQFYDYPTLTAMMTQPENKNILGQKFPIVIPTANPAITTIKLGSLPTGSELVHVLTQESSSVSIHGKPSLPKHVKWPLTGGVLCEKFSCMDEIENLLLAGYENGSVCIWNMKHMVLEPLCVLKGKVEGIELCGLDAPVTVLDICFLTSSLAVGNGHGLVRVYNLDAVCEEESFHFVTETKHEVHSVQMNGGICCNAVLCFLNSPVKCLQFICSGVNLVIGYDCCKIAVLEVKSFSLVYLSDPIPGSASPMICMTSQTILSPPHLLRGLVPSVLDTKSDVEVAVVFTLTKTALLIITNGATGDIICSCDVGQKGKSAAISMYVIDSMFSGGSVSKMDSTEENAQVTETENASHYVTKIGNLGKRIGNTLLLICFADYLCLYDMKPFIQGQNSIIEKVKLPMKCCWTGFVRKDGVDLGLLLLYENGDLEIRNLPSCALVKETSLMTILRWNFNPQMEQMMSCSEHGEIVLVNGSEVAVISVLSTEISCFPESLPRLFDKAVAAAADDSLRNSKKGTSGIFGGLVKSIKGKKPRAPNFSHLESIFSSSQCSDSPETVNDIEVPELDIDGIEIDEPEYVASTSSHTIVDDQRVKNHRRERSSRPENADRTPRTRTPQEIIAAYRRTGDVSSVAADARHKLAERQEKLERMSQRTEELRSGAENFASTAKELARTMERRKWWKI